MFIKIAHFEIIFEYRIIALEIWNRKTTLKPKKRWLKVTMCDGKTSYEGRVVALDLSSDLALVKLQKAVSGLLFYLA